MTTLGTKKQLKSLLTKLKDQLEYDPRVSMGYYVEDGPKKGTGFGKVTFMARKDVPEEVTKAIINKVLPKEFEIQYVENMYDLDPGERDYFAHIKFEFPVDSVKI